MQIQVPEITDLSKEPDSIIKLYSPDCLIPGSYASNCLLARKLSESGVRFVQLYHQGWDQHFNLAGEMPGQAKDVDRASAALITDLNKEDCWTRHWSFGVENLAVPIIARVHSAKAFMVEITILEPV